MHFIYLEVHTGAVFTVLNEKSPFNFTNSEVKNFTKNFS